MLPPHIKVIPTEISTTLVRARTSTVSKKVKRFLLVGRVVRLVRLG